MIGTFQKTLLEYVGSGKEIKYIANLLKLSKLRLTEEVEKLENLGYLGVATQPNPEFLTKSAIAKHRSLTGSGFEQSDR
ncbi:MAG: hypothetical protein MK111_06870, partial [Crocosphaera sp.]